MGRPNKIQFKVGQTVRATYDCSGSVAGEIYKLVPEVDGMSDVKLKGTSCSCQKGWVLVEESNAYKQGDILVRENGDERKILGVCGEVYFISDMNNGGSVSDCAYTKKDLDGCGYKLKSEKDEEVEAAIKLLKKKGKLKDGKILEE